MLFTCFIICFRPLPPLLLLNLSPLAKNVRSQNDTIILTRLFFLPGKEARGSVGDLNWLTTARPWIGWATATPASTLCTFLLLHAMTTSGLAPVSSAGTSCESYLQARCVCLFTLTCFGPVPAICTVLALYCIGSTVNVLFFCYFLLQNHKLLSALDQLRSLG